jgi:hypothetical protein
MVLSLSGRAASHLHASYAPKTHTHTHTHTLFFTYTWHNGWGGGLCAKVGHALVKVIRRRKLTLKAVNFFALVVVPVKVVQHLTKILHNI